MAETENTTAAPSDTPKGAGARVAALAWEHAKWAVQFALDEEVRAGLSAWTAALVRRAKLVPAERVADLVLRGVVVGAVAVGRRPFEQLEAEALDAIKRGE